MTEGRRSVLLGLACLGATAPFRSFAQKLAIKRVGILAPRTKPPSVETDVTYGAFVKRLRQLGYAEGRTIEYEWRFAEGKYERLPALATELANAKVDVILAATPPSVAAAKAATSTIPIVMVALGDPVALGFVRSFSRPGGNITGVSNAIDDASRKYLEFLRLAMPKLSTAAALVNPDNVNVQSIYAPIERTARSMGIALSPVEANSAERIKQAFGAMRRSPPQALIVQGDGFFFVQRQLIADLALQNRIATMFWTWEPVEAGGLMSYGQDVADDYSRAADYVDRILKGAQPREMPIEQPTHPKLTINLKTAGALGLKISEQLILRADRVIR